jgi:hypothetical protein
MTRRIMTVLGVLAIGITGISAPALAQGPDPRQVYIQSISYGGSGCPQGSVGQSISNDRTSFTLIFDQFVAASGPGVPVTEARKNCQINVNLHVPAGVGNSIVSLDYRGYVQLDAGAQATQGAVYDFAGNSPRQSSTDFAGPLAVDYLQSDAVPLLTQKLELPACGGVVPLNVNSQIRIYPGTDSSLMTTDSIDGRVRTLGRLPDVGC